MQKFNCFILYALKWLKDEIYNTNILEMSNFLILKVRTGIDDCLTSISLGFHILDHFMWNITMFTFYTEVNLYFKIKKTNQDVVV